METHLECFDKCQNLGKKISEEFLLEHAGYDDRDHLKSELQTIAEMNQKRGRNVWNLDLVLLSLSTTQNLFNSIKLRL